MLKDGEKNYRRLNAVTVAFLVLGAIFVLRLFERQVLQTAQFSKQADAQYYTKIDQPAKRGEIYIKDNDSQNLIDETKSGLFPVATDLELFDVLAVPRNIPDKGDTAKKLATILGIDEKTIFDQINRDKWYIPPIKKRIGKDDADKIVALNLKGIMNEGSYYRFYPENNFLSQVLGFVDYSGNGRYGIEGYYDGLLKGEGGVLTGLKDNTGKIIKVEQSEPGKDGASVVLTIDRSVQYMAEKKLKEGIDRYGAVGGSIVVMNPKDGSILAMASNPDFDPNKFNEIPQDQQNIFINPTVQSNWEPGSIFKPVIVASGLEDKKIEPDSKPDEIPGGFKKSITVNGYEIHNSLNKDYGYETVTQILENSDNIGMVWIANKMDNPIINDYFNKFGFGEKTKIDLAGEASGQIPPVKSWQDVNRATMSFGQGISVTPIQIMQAYSAFANGGKMVRPRIIDEIIDSNDKAKKIDVAEPTQVISPENAAKMTAMLVSVVENGHGKNAKVDGFQVAGKTGTAQIPKAGGGYEEGANIGSFAGFAPANDPRFVMLVKFDRPKNVQWAESSAAPIFGEMADWLLNSYMKVPKQ